MGMDFSALLQYQDRDRLLRALDVLESDSTLPTLRDVTVCWREAGFAEFPPEWARPAWVPAAGGNEEPGQRPELPSKEAALRLPEGFFLTIGVDAVWLYHLLRWRQFLTVDRWRSVMLAAVRELGELFGTNDSILAHDCHKSMFEVWHGRSIDEALAVAELCGEGEVEDFGGLYLEVGDSWNSKGFWRYRW